MTAGHDRPQCRKCSQTKNVKLRRQYASNGATQVFWYCTNCQVKAESKFVSKAQAIVIASRYGRSLTDIPLLDDYRNRFVCEVCGAEGAEYHHWLPQCFAELVEDHSAWPTAYLCKSCHDIWHETVTPYLPGRGRTEYAQYTKEKYLWLEMATS